MEKREKYMLQFVFLMSLSFSFQSILSSTSPLDEDWVVVDEEPVEHDQIDVASMIAEKISQAKIDIESEQNYKAKSLLVAQAYADLMAFALENDLDIEEIRQDLKDSLDEINQELGKWQYNYEWIIGKTRTQDNENWTAQEKEQLLRAKHIYQRLSSNQGESWQDILSGYEKLDYPIQQALLSAIEQGLKVKNIEEIIAQILFPDELGNFYNRYGTIIESGLETLV